jgi:hypothetical protein
MKNNPVAAIRSHPWPSSPLLELPGGDLRNYGGGKVLSAQQFVLIVGLSPQHFIAVEKAPGIGAVQPVLEQAVGFLWGRGAWIQRVKLRCPMAWFTEATGEFLWKRCFVFFTRALLAIDPTNSRPLPPNVWPVEPVCVLADAGRLHWLKVRQILEGIEASDPDLLMNLGASLATVARRWEYSLARAILLSQRMGEWDSSDMSSVAECDHLLYQLMAKYETEYEFLPLTIARLL